MVRWTRNPFLTRGKWRGVAFTLSKRKIIIYQKRSNLACHRHLIYRGETESSKEQTTLTKPIMNKIVGNVN